MAQQNDNANKGNNKIKVLYFGTHINQKNGYSKVVYNLMKNIIKSRKVDITLWGFQDENVQQKKQQENQMKNLEKQLQEQKDEKVKKQMKFLIETGKKNQENQQEIKLRELKGLKIVNAAKNEKEYKQGFGIDEIQDHLKTHDYDVVIIFNDPIIISQVINKIETYYSQEKKEKDRPAQKTSEGCFLSRPKIITYIDQVFTQYDGSYLTYINQHVDLYIAFTESWKEVLGLALEDINEKNKRIEVLEHACDKEVFFKLRSKYCKRYFGIEEDKFVILNLNRNTPRKRLDISISAFVYFLKKLKMNDYKTEDIQLVLGSLQDQGYNVQSVFKQELIRQDLQLENPQQYIIPLGQQAQQLTDKEINILYNATDVGLNTSQGEGFGLCNYEQATIGVPQIVPQINGVKDIFNDVPENMVTPQGIDYIVNPDMNIGNQFSEQFSYKDYGEQMYRLYTDRGYYKEIQEKNVELQKKYNWETLAKRLIEISKSVLLDEEKEGVEQEPGDDSIDEMNHEDLVKLVREYKKQMKNK